MLVTWDAPAATNGQEPPTDGNDFSGKGRSLFFFQHFFCEFFFGKKGANRHYDKSWIKLNF